MVAEGSDNVGGEAKIKILALFPKRRRASATDALVWVFGYGGCSVH